MNFVEEMKLIRQGVKEIISEDELLMKLEKSNRTGVPLRIKYGIDPTGSDIHIGHLVSVRKMRNFQDMGHTGVIIIGDLTAQIGDPTGRDNSRSPLTADNVKRNAEKYMDQLYTILDKNKTEVRWQTEWFGDMTMTDILKLMGKWTLAQFLTHNTFHKRYEKGLSLGMHEIMYPILQGYDSVAVNADVELGATEQKFNILCGRDMQRHFGQEQQIAILSPILMGINGVNKMSKSLGNYIAVYDTSQNKYGKVMSIPDELIINYFKYASSLSSDEVDEVKKELLTGKTNPKLIKQRLAREIVSMYHGKESAMQAEEYFNTIFSRKEIPDNMLEYKITPPVKIIEVLVDSGLCDSNGEVKRLIKQNAISIDNEKIKYFDMEITKSVIIKIGKK